MLSNQNELKALAQRFKCPILQERMQNPVMAADGHTYEREAIASWIAKRGARALSPMTGEPLAHLELQPNFLVKAMIEDYKASAPARKQRQLTQQDLELAIQLREEELEAMLAKQRGRIKSLEQSQRDVEPSQMNPLEAGNSSLGLFQPTQTAKANPPFFQLEVKSIYDNKAIRFKVKPNTRVYKLKEVFCLETGIPVDQIRFIGHGRRLEDDESLGESGLGEGDTIHCVLRQTGD